MTVFKNKYFVPALALMLFSATFTFGPDGIAWFWAGRPVVAVMLIGASAAFWGLLYQSRRKWS